MAHRDFNSRGLRPGARDPLTRALRSARGGFLWVLVFSFFVNLLMLTAPLYMLQLFDRVLSSRSTDTLLLLTVIAGAAILAMAVLEGVRHSVMVRISAWLDSKLAGPVLSASVVGTLRQLQDPSVQGLRDLSTLRGFFTGPAIFPILDAPWAPIYLAVIFLLHPVLGWISTGGALLLFLLGLVNELSTRKLLARSGGSSIRALQQAEAAVRNADAIEAMGLMSNLVSRWDRLNGESLSMQTRAGGRSGALTALSKFIRLALQILVLGTGAWLVIQAEITAGAMIAASILMGRGLAPVEQAIGSWKMAVSARGAYQRLKEQLTRIPQRPASMRLPMPKGELSVEGLTYAHPGASEPLLRGIGLRLAPGEALGLIGPSGAGKTTLARLMLGNMPARLGHVRLDGMDVAQWDPEDLGQYCGYLPQDVELFSGSIRENIARMGDGDAEAVLAAAELAGCHRMIVRFPKGYDTPIGEGGASLSGGERQRIALARALYGEPRFVVLDEPNASLDAVGEDALLAALQSLKARGVTVVIVGHRPRLLQHVDKVLALGNGYMQAFGPREEVLAKVTVKPNQPTAVQIHG